MYVQHKGQLYVLWVYSALRGAKTFSAVGYCSPRSGVEWWEPSRGRVCKKTLSYLLVGVLCG